MAAPTSVSHLSPPAPAATGDCGAATHKTGEHQVWPSSPNGWSFECPKLVEAAVPARPRCPSRILTPATPTSQPIGPPGLPDQFRAATTTCRSPPLRPRHAWVPWRTIHIACLTRGRAPMMVHSGGRFTPAPLPPLGSQPARPATGVDAARQAPSGLVGQSATSHIPVESM